MAQQHQRLAAYGAFGEAHDPANNYQGAGPSTAGHAPAPHVQYVAPTPAATAALPRPTPVHVPAYTELPTSKMYAADSPSARVGAGSSRPSLQDALRIASEQLGLMSELM